MRNRKAIIYNKEWFENNSLKNPITSLDHDLERYYPDFYSINYETKLLATDTPTKHERESIIYNDYIDKYGTTDLNLLIAELQKSNCKNIFLNGFTQELFDYITPYIKATAEIIFFFKCQKIYDMSALSEFSNLKCVHMFYNNALTKLWNMSKCENFKVLSLNTVTRLTNIDELKDSFVEYIHIDSLDNYGNKKTALFNVPAFNEFPNLKHLYLNFKNCKIIENI